MSVLELESGDPIVAPSICVNSLPSIYIYELKYISNLEQELQQRKGINDRNSDSTQDKVKHCRVERSKKRKRRKIKRNKERRRAQKKLQRGRREQRETEKWTKLLSTAVEVEKTLQEKRPLDRTSVDWTPAQLKLLAKGQKFVPSPHKVDRVSKYKDFMAFARKLRLALYFSRIREETGEEGIGTSLDTDKMPWEKPSALIHHPAKMIH